MPHFLQDYAENRAADAAATEARVVTQARQQLPPAGCNPMPAPTTITEAGTAPVVGGTIGVLLEAPFQTTPDSGTTQRLDGPGKDISGT